MDGVILDSSYAWWRSFNSTLRHFGSRPLSKKTFISKYWKGGTVSNIIEMFRNDFKNKRLDQTAVKYCNDVFSEFLESAKLYRGAKKVLSFVASNYKTALVTNTRRHDVFRILKKNGIEKFFNVVVTIDDVSKGKPDPQIILKACKALRTKPKNSILVGDSDADVIAGTKAGCKVVGVGIDADMRISNIRELPKLLESTKNNF